MSPAEAETAVESALKSGVRLIDTANGYMNESGTGRGIKKSGVAREDIFLVTKLWPTVYEKEMAIDESLKRLDTDYIDLHTATPDMINCAGCRIDGVKTPFCDSLCPIRQCALTKDIETCGDCGEMSTCEKLVMITGNNESI